jgi:integrase/recombinase XerC
MNNDYTISQALARYLDAVYLARSENTWRAYSNALAVFVRVLEDYKISPEETDISHLDEDGIAWMAAELKGYTPATEQLYMTATVGFYKFLVAEGLADINLPRIEMIVRMRGRRPGARLPQFPRAEIEQLISYAQNLNTIQVDDDRHLFRNLRDRAFLLTLADTGLRVHEACNLRRGDVDWNEGKAVLIGKGDREDLVRFSSRSRRGLQDYLNARAKLDGASGRPLPSLPVFARHDKGAGDHVKPITPTTGRNIVKQRVKECLGTDAVGTITPHSFRHYFVTTVLLGSGGNLKLAQELARHQNIAVTQRYAHLTNDELDRGYYEIFENDD